MRVNTSWRTAAETGRSARITGRKRRSDDALDEIRFRGRIRFEGSRVTGREPRREPALEHVVLAGGGAMLAEIVTERERAPLFDASRLDDVHVMRVRPFRWTMKE